MGKLGITKQDLVSYKEYFASTYTKRTIAVTPFALVGTYLGTILAQTYLVSPENIQLIGKLTTNDAKVIGGSLIGAALLRWPNYIYLTHEKSKNLENRQGFKRHIFKSFVFGQACGAVHTAIKSSIMYYLNNKYNVDYTLASVLGFLTGTSAYLYLMHVLGTYSGLSRDYTENENLGKERVEKGVFSNQNSSIDNRF
ncbi:hypothetical protein J4403_02620 [Candidatus Woesearchaeota archaeon]|nr:hypothetical protein [Candidatus Woesearchaeota archaeon]